MKKRNKGGHVVMWSWRSSRARGALRCASLVSHHLGRKMTPQTFLLDPPKSVSQGANLPRRLWRSNGLPPHLHQTRSFLHWAPSRGGARRGTSSSILHFRARAPWGTQSEEPFFFLAPRVLESGHFPLRFGFMLYFLLQV